jgi:hypothetical protein
MASGFVGMDNQQSYRSAQAFPIAVSPIEWLGVAIALSKSAGKLRYIMDSY